MSLESYWPKADAVNACIKNEAETADVAVLLAVHQPSPLGRRSAGSADVIPASEDDLLDAFLTDDVPGGALLVPITGPSGVGKSHIVRWLDAQLQRSEKAEQFHIIRIPKSASLRTVVGLILAPLAGDPRYAKPSADLTRAVAEVNIDDAVITFRAHLENALKSLQDGMLSEIRQHPGRTHLRALIGHAQMLPRLFSDAALVQHFTDRVLSRVVARALDGRSGAGTSEDLLSQFTANDLMLPRGIDLSQAAKAVRDYYMTQIAVTPGERLQPVVDMLNSAVDPAIGNVFQLEQSTGGMTLQDIILAVREILLQDGKDLVLLIEDFQALAGIQEVLLKVCIQEGEYEGKKVRATMRTAVALTDGYLTFRDTILTRAQREWVIGGRPQSDEEIKAAVVEMVGAYLNAARWGEAELRRLFGHRGPDQAATGWLPAWRNEDIEDEENEAIHAFGFNQQGASLFPFNRNAIEQLAERHLSQGTRLNFNPRRLINEILRHTLLMRPTFEARGFPPAQFRNASLNETVAMWLAKTRRPDQVRQRLTTLLAVWGGNPTDEASIGRIPPSIFKAFDLPTPAELANIPFKPAQVEPTVSKEPIAPKGTSPIIGAPKSTDPPHPSNSPAVDPEMAEWSAKLGAWVGGMPLMQKDARDVRNALCLLLKDAINWPSLRIREVPIKPQWIAIPNARGSDAQVGHQLQLCDEYRDEDGSVRLGILAALRYSREKSWNYPGSDDDYLSSSALVDHLVDQLQPILIQQAVAEAAALAATLITQARITGLSPPVRPLGNESILGVLFSEPQPKRTQGFEDGWDKLRESANDWIDGKAGREVLQSELLDRVASFQGGGGKPFAIDIARIAEVMAIDSPAADAADRLPDGVKAFMKPLSDNRLRTQLVRVVSKLRDFKTSIGGIVDADFDKSAFVADLQAVVRLLDATATFPSGIAVSLKEFDRMLTDFQASPVVDLLTKTTTIVEEADGGQIPKLLNALGSLDFDVIERTKAFLDSAVALLNAAEASVAREEGMRNQVDPSRISNEIVTLLSTIAGATQSEQVV